MSIVPLHKIPTKAEAQKIVRELVAKGMVSWSKHAKERMEERNINTQQVLTCLAKGQVTENPVLANRAGNAAGYDITVERLTAGDYLRVGVCLRVSQTALVVTAMKIK
jgi:hypothetical protein